MEGRDEWSVRTVLISLCCLALRVWNFEMRQLRLKLLHVDIDWYIFDILDAAHDVWDSCLADVGIFSNLGLFEG
jgi:hypothetical protein